MNGTLTALGLAPSLEGQPFYGVVGAQAPQLSWGISDDVQSGARKIGFAVLIIWIGYLLARVALPSSRFGGGRLPMGRMLGALVAIVIMMDLNRFVDLANLVIEAAYSAWDFIKNLAVSS